MWRVEEQLSVPGRFEKMNEDGIVIRIEGARTLFAVLDGVSSIDRSVMGFRHEESTRLVPGGYWAMRQVQAALEHLNLTAVENALEAVIRADAALDEAIHARNLHHHPRWKLPAVAAIVVFADEKQVTWAQVADGLLMLERPDGVRFALEDPMREIDQRMLRVFADCNCNHEDSRVRAVLEEQYQRRNQTTYPVLDGAVKRCLVRSGRHRLDEVHRLALWSDGLCGVTDDLHIVGRTILTEGLGTWYQRVVEREDADPGFRNPLRFNNDDKTGLVVTRT